MANSNTKRSVNARISLSRMLSFGGPAAIEHERGAGHQRRGVGGEEHDGAGEFIELAETAELYLRQHFIAKRLVLEERPRHRRFQKGRTQTVDANVVRRKLDR